MQIDRRFASRPFLSLLAAVMLLLGSATSIFAQATPEATPSANGAGPNLGDAIVLHDTSGEETIQIAATDLVDPDKAVENADRGFHWVGVEVVVNNPTDTDFEFNSYAITVIDGEGFAYNSGFASRSSDDTEQRPDFSESTVPADGTISGWLFYQIVNDATPAWIVYNDAFNAQQFAVLANLEGTTIEDGAETPFYDADAQEIGTVIVDDIITDFQKSDSEITPARGMTTVAVALTIAATGETDLQPNSYSFSLVDDFGFLYNPQYYFRSEASTTQYPDLPTDTLTAGSDASGVVLFEIPKDAQISYITYAPDYTQFYILAQPGPGSTISGDTLTPVANPTSTSGDDTPEATEDTGSTGGTETGDCVGVNDWASATAENVAFLDQLFSDTESLADVDPADLHAAADQMRDAAKAQGDVETPEVAQATSDAVVDLLNTWAGLFDDAADRLEKGDDPADIENDLSNSPEFTDTFTSLFTELTNLQTTCPDSDLTGIFG
jgi:uncharacterized protein DUF4352